MIKNKTKNKVISGECKVCKSSLSKSIGLMFSKKEFVPLVFVFDKEKIIPLHMMFVFFSIDVLFLNSDKVVVEMKENFKPFSSYTPKNKSMYVVELQRGSIEKNKIEIGDEIEF